MDRVVRTMTASVAAHPHSAEIYSKLLRAAAQKVGGKFRAYRIHGDRFAMLINVSKPAPNAAGSIKLSSFFGSIVTFTRVDVDGPWVNVETGDLIGDEERAAINIPAGLHPNRKEFRFRFYLDRHLMVVENKNETGTLAPSGLLKLLEQAFAQPHIRQEYGDVHVTILPERRTIEKILRSRIRRIHLIIETPNPGDDIEEEEQNIERRLEEMHARRMEETYVAKTGQTLQPDEELKERARVAADSGSVSAIVLRDGSDRLVRTMSTQQSPRIDEETYDPKHELAIGAFERAAEGMIAGERERAERRKARRRN